MHEIKQLQVNTDNLIGRTGVAFFHIFFAGLRPYQKSKTKSKNYYALKVYT